MNKHALFARNVEILQRHVRGERTIREEADAQGLRFQRIHQIIKQTTKRLMKDLERPDLSRQEVLDFYRLTDEQVFRLVLEQSDME